MAISFAAYRAICEYPPFAASTDGSSTPLLTLNMYGFAAGALGAAMLSPFQRTGLPIWFVAFRGALTFGPAISIQEVLIKKVMGR